MRSATVDRAEALRPGRLWSLWDFMIKFDVRLMVTRMHHLEQFEKDLLDQLPAGTPRMEPQMKAFGQPCWQSDDARAFTTPAGRQWIWAHLGPLQVELGPLNLVASQLEITHIWNHADRWTRKRLAESFATLRWKIEQELNDKHFLYLDKSEAALFDSNEPFGAGVASAFPTSNEELRDASQCLALNKGTASVFHSMRAVEAGIGALARDVGRTYSSQTWHNILDEIQSAISALQKNGIPGIGKEQKDERLEFLSRAVFEIRYFKDGWRNYVSHNKRPYDASEAKSAFEHVGSFMKTLSEKLSE